MKKHNFDSAFEAVQELVGKFKQGETHYLSPSFNEQEARKYFIDKFFIALGWDVNHDYQHDPYKQEVKIEKTQSNQKRTDYTFFLNPNFKDPKFFAEAKKPSQNLKNADYYFQTVRYGWNANTPIALLTDFEELHILDCRFRPDINSVLNNPNHKQFHYSQYADKEIFSKIYYLFSREALLDNSLERYAESLSKPKGKAFQKGLFKGGYQSIDESFLEYLDEVRESLAKAFKKNEAHLTSEELTEATQRTIDRLVFIRFLEDKLIEQENYVSEFGNSCNPWSDFISTCKKLNAKYNGIVFKKHSIDEQNFAGPELSEFQNICQEICHLNSPYDFNVIPIHILGSIYERFLGKVVHATAKRVTVETKPEVKKAGGVYYTPKYIVDYIVRNTIGKLIEGKTPEQIAELRFADIACGSGSFLIGVFDYLLDYHNRYYQEHPNKAKKDKCIKKDGLWVLSIKQKQKILLNNIYGVDIDQQAIEVTQLSLSLKLLEDETTATANEMMVMFHEKILPDMSKNIICGNSLIGSDILTQNLFSGIEEKKLSPIDFEKVFPEVFKSKTEEGYVFIPDIGMDEDQDINTSQLNEPMHHYKKTIKGGFDAIVGNPPWVDIKSLAPIQVKYFFSKYACTENRINLYAVFIERCLELINKNGLFGYIIPNSILYQSSYTKLRKVIIKKHSVSLIVRMPDNTFKDVKAETAILIINGTKTKAKCKCILYDRNDKITHIDDKNAKEIKQLNQNNWENKAFSTFDLYSSEETNLIINKIEKSGKSLIDICDFSLGLTPYDKYKGHTKYQIEERVFHSNSKNNKSFKKLLAGSDIERYFVEWGGKEYISYGNWLGAPREQRFFTEERILIRQIVSGKSMRIYAGLTTEELYNTQSVFNLILKNNRKENLKYVLGILNSSLMNFYHAYKYLDLSKNLFQKILIQNCKKFPIPNINLKNKTEKAAHDKIVFLVDQMLEAKREIKTAKTEKDKNYYERKCASLDIAIDTEVYKLYDLTNEEIETIKNNK